MTSTSAPAGQDADAQDTLQEWRSAMAAGSHAARRRDLAGALQAFDAAVKLAPERIEGWINLGSMMVESRQLPAAVNVLGEARERRPDSALVHMILGDAQRLLGRREAALSSYEAAVALERAPVALNRLACMIRHHGEHAQALALYEEALRGDPNLSIARVNRATLHAAMGDHDAAEAELRALSHLRLPPVEAREVASCLGALGEYRRLGGLLEPLTAASDLAPLVDALRNLPQELRAADRAALETIARYRKHAARATPRRRPLDVELPADWPLIEALHMVPWVHSVDDYLRYTADTPNAQAPYNIELHQSQNMEAAVIACRRSRAASGDPVRLEAHLRHWHRLACDRVPGFKPGHFKYNRNVDYRNPGMPLVEPGAASSTFRLAVRKAYAEAAPGIVRAALAFLIVADLHPFDDGNGRVGMTWLNRELEWAGEMPALFAEHLGPNGGFGAALHAVRTNGGDLTPMFEAIGAAQDYARQFCMELANRRRA